MSGFYKKWYQNKLSIPCGVSSQIEFLVLPQALWGSINVGNSEKVHAAHWTKLGNEAAGPQVGKLESKCYLLIVYIERIKTKDTP